MNIPSRESKKVRELPCFYSDVKEIKDPSKTFSALKPSVSIPEQMMDLTEILKAARDNEFQWVLLVADLAEFEPNTSWSAYHSRNEAVQGRVKSVNSSLPLLPQM